MFGIENIHIFGTVSYWLMLLLAVITAYSVLFKLEELSCRLVSWLMNAFTGIIAAHFPLYWWNWETARTFEEQYWFAWFSIIIHLAATWLLAWMIEWFFAGLLLLFQSMKKWGHGAGNLPALFLIIYINSHKCKKELYFLV